MCDYSLHNVASRAAKLGDKLVVTDFAKTITRGFAAVGEPTVAICVFPGTELAFQDHVQYHHAFSRSGIARVNDKVARFLSSCFIAKLGKLRSLVGFAPQPQS